MEERLRDDHAVPCWACRPRERASHTWASDGLCHRCRKLLDALPTALPRPKHPYRSHGALHTTHTYPSGDAA